jgi:hypothetical protein
LRAAKFVPTQQHRHAARDEQSQQEVLDLSFPQGLDPGFRLSEEQAHFYPFHTGPGKKFTWAGKVQSLSQNQKIKYSSAMIAGRGSATVVARIASGKAASAATTQRSERGSHNGGRYHSRSIEYRPRCHEGRCEHVAKATLRLSARRPNDHEESKSQTSYD